MLPGDDGVHGLGVEDPTQPDRPGSAAASCPGRLHVDISLAIALSALIGSVSFAGSMIAFAKLQELLSGRPITYPGQQVVNALLAGGILACAIAIVRRILELEIQRLAAP